MYELMCGAPGCAATATVQVDYLVNGDPRTTLLCAQHLKTVHTLVAEAVAGDEGAEILFERLVLS